MLTDHAKLIQTIAGEVPNFRLAGEKNYDPKSCLSHHPYLLRSGCLKNISTQSLHSLKEVLDLQCHINLMSENEIHNAPQFINFGIERKHFPLEENVSGFKKNLYPSFIDYYQHYDAMIEHNRVQLIRIIEFIAESEYQRFLLSCYAGKDRTGIIIFLIFSLLGIDTHHILNDYTLSGQYLLPHIDQFKSNWQKRNINKHDYMFRLLPDERTIIYLLVHISRVYGSISNFLFTIGLSKRVAMMLKAKFYTYKNLELIRTDT